MGSRFDDDTAIVEVAGGPAGAGSGASRRFEGRMDRGWWIERGPNGGYVAAVVLRALGAAVDDPLRTPRSLTVHYVAPPAEGVVQIETTVERAGRSMTFVTGRLHQGERLIALAMAAFAPALAGVEFSDLAPPKVPWPEELPVSGTTPGAPHIELRDRYEMRWAIGAVPFSGSDKAVAGGWIRLADPRPVDHLLVAALTDAWMPPLFSRIEERMGVPTIDLTVHFRAPLDPPPGHAESDGWFLVVFRSQMAADGFVEEDGEVWSRDGRLLAHSRQLAITLSL